MLWREVALTLSDILIGEPVTLKPIPLLLNGG